MWVLWRARITDADKTRTEPSGPSKQDPGDAFFSIGQCAVQQPRASCLRTSQALLDDNVPTREPVLRTDARTKKKKKKKKKIRSPPPIPGSESRAPSRRYAETHSKLIYPKIPRSL